MDQQHPSPGPTTRASAHKARRPRAARACDACRLKKNKCDELLPCTFCRNRRIECVYKGQGGRYNSDYVRDLEDRVKQLSGMMGPQQDGDSGMSMDQPPPAATVDAVNFSPPPPILPPPDLPLMDLDGSTVHEHPRDESDVMSTIGSASTRVAGEQEVSGINRHTRNVEFYGSSSSVALLSHIQRAGKQNEAGGGGALVTSLHNPAFHSPDTHGQASRGSDQPQTPQHYSHCRGFLENYFSAIHYVHPILDKQHFLDRCEGVWSGAEGADGPSSFVALYYSVLSIGALIGVRDDEPIDGITNLQWSRKFFEVAKEHCNKLGMVTNLDMVHAYFLLAKVCQNELSPHRRSTALAMGINREPGPNTKVDPAQRRAESRTWWGLYSLETEMSFAMGRPDTLGADLFHNRRYPLIRGAPDTDISRPELLDPPHCAIIKCMVDFSRITRSICLSIYLSEDTVSRTVSTVHRIEQDLDRWVEGLPEAVRPKVHAPAGAPTSSLRAAKDPQWVKRQKLVLNIRYHNLRILLFGSLLLKSSATERATIPGAREATQKYLDSASKTIDIIYQTYEHNDFFRTWFYNTTYTVFAASIILVYVMREATEEESQPLLRRVDMAIEILEIMDECVVALESAKLLRRAKEKAKGTVPSTPDPALAGFGFEGPMLLSHYWGPLDFLDGEIDLDMAFQIADMEIPTGAYMAQGHP
ncbi:hypothetical protein F5X68DRAFT_171820 [Plectosphaerella plurivora]|uniref:Zn(2)-C6 fungal-type domain-containing protein n=1 Tax=Plectosphaerella plurivora TaxID=936078 RepID=A0A9P8V9N9_9PEZI|nr:hypothetical protein F5X68DRAFT_171820 [Plectosphaerella plurivora]